MKIVVDFDLCRGHGECEGEAPEVFQVDDQGNFTSIHGELPQVRRNITTMSFNANGDRLVLADAEKIEVCCHRRIREDGLSFGQYVLGAVSAAEVMENQVFDTRVARKTRSGGSGEVSMVFG